MIARVSQAAVVALPVVAVHAGASLAGNDSSDASPIGSIARRLLDIIPMPNVPGAPLGSINYEQPYVRSKTTNQFDIKAT